MVNHNNAVHRKVERFNADLTQPGALLLVNDRDGSDKALTRPLRVGFGWFSCYGQNSFSTYIEECILFYELQLLFSFSR